MKKIRGLALVLACGLLLVACGAQPGNANSFLIKESAALTQTMQQLAQSAEYIRLMSGSHAVASLAEQVEAQDFATPKAAYLMAMIDTLLLRLMDAETKNTLPEPLQDKLSYKINGSVLSSMINASFGPETLAALSLFSWSQSYQTPKDWAGNRIVLLEYDGDFSAIASFHQSGQDVITVNASLVKNGDIGLKDQVKQIFGQNSFPMEEVAGDALTALLTASDN